MKLKLSSLFIALFFLTLFLFSCRSVSPYSSLITGRVDKSFAELEISEGVYVRRYETSNYEYNQFLKSIKLDNKALWESCKIDSTGWTVSPLNSKVLEGQYHWHPAYDNYPVLNVSYAAANEYCKWLIKKYKHRKKDEKVKFRLPTEKEFMYLIETVVVKSNANNRKYFGELKTDIISEANVYACETSSYTEVVFKYIQNTQGFCSIIGNVSEFTSEGKILGGSWNSLSGETNKIDSNTLANPSVGFRVVMEIFE